MTEGRKINNRIRNIIIRQPESHLKSAVYLVATHSGGCGLSYHVQQDEQRSNQGLVKRRVENKHSW